jgi:hypothetical protein
VRKFAFLAAIWSLAASEQKLPHDLTAATLEELMNFEVTSVRRADRPEELNARPRCRLENAARWLSYGLEPLKTGIP